MALFETIQIVHQRIWDKFGANAPLVVASIVTLIGLVFWIPGSIAIYSWNGPPEVRPAFWFFLLKDLGSIILISGVVGVFSDFLRYSGVIHDTVVDVFRSEETKSIICHSVDFDHLIEKRSDRDDVWRRLTRRIYLRDTDPTRVDGTPLSRQVELAIGRRFPAEDEFLYRDLKRTLILNWKDENESVLSIVEIIDCEIIPFTPTKECTITSTFTAGAGLKVEDYGRYEDELLLDGVKINILPSEIKGEPIKIPDKGMVNVSAVLNNNYQKINVKIPPCNHMHCRRKRKSIQNVLIDPTLIRTSPGIVDGLELKVECQISGLKMQFETIGLPDGSMPELLDKDTKFYRPLDSDRRYKGIVLPEEGYMLTLWRSP